MTLNFGTHNIGAVACGPRADQIALTNFMVGDGLRPIIDSEFAVADVEAAYAWAHAGGFGKIMAGLA